MNKKLILILVSVLVLAISAITVFAVAFSPAEKPVSDVHRKLMKPRKTSLKQKTPKEKAFPEPLANRKEITAISAAQCIKTFTKPKKCATL